MPAGSQCENRMATVRVKAPGGATNGSSFIAMVPGARLRAKPVRGRRQCSRPPARPAMKTAGASWRQAEGLHDMREDVAVGRVARLRRAEVNEVDHLTRIDDGDVFPLQRRGNVAIVDAGEVIY